MYDMTAVTNSLPKKNAVDYAYKQGYLRLDRVTIFANRLALIVVGCEDHKTELNVVLLKMFVSRNEEK